MTPADGGEGRRQLDHGAQLLADFTATPLRSMAAVYVAYVTVTLADGSS